VKLFFDPSSESSLTILLGLLVAILSGCGGSDEIPSEFEFPSENTEKREAVVIGQVPSRSVIEMVDNRRPLTRSLSSVLNRNVQLRVADSYEGILKRMDNEEFDMVFLGPLAYVEAVDKLDVPYRPLVRPVRFGNADYHSIIFTHEDRNISGLSELRGKTMALVDPNSTSGYLFPRALMIEESGVDPMSDLNRVDFVGGHDRVVDAVADGDFDAGAVYKDARKDELEAEMVERLPILAQSRPIPSEPVVILETLPTDLQDKLLRYFVSIDEHHPDVMEILGRNIEEFVETDDRAYDDVRTVVNTIKRAENQ